MFRQRQGDYEDYEDVAEDDYGDDSDDIDEGTEEQARLDPAEVEEQNPWTASSYLSISEAQEEETQGCTSTSPDLAASARRPLLSPRPLPKSFLCLHVQVKDIPNLHVEPSFSQKISQVPRSDAAPIPPNRLKSIFVKHPKSAGINLF